MFRLFVKPWLILVFCGFLQVENVLAAQDVELSSGAAREKLLCRAPGGKNAYEGSGSGIVQRWLQGQARRAQFLENLAPFLRSGHLVDGTMSAPQDAKSTHICEEARTYVMLAEAFTFLQKKVKEKAVNITRELGVTPLQLRVLSEKLQSKARRYRAYCA